MSLSCKFLITLAILCLLSIAGNYLLCLHHVRKIENDWPAYRKHLLESSLEEIQRRFTSLEQTSFKTLEKLLDNSCLIREMSQWQGADSRIRIFQDLLNFPFASSEKERGIAVYNRERECVAWRGWVFNVPPQYLDEGLNGGRFSVIVYSEENVYAVLCTFVAIPDARENEHVGTGLGAKAAAHIFPQAAQEHAGVAVAFLPLDSNYSVSTKITALEQYIKSRSFSEEMLNRQPFLQKVQIHFDNITSSPGQKNLCAPLRNLNGDSLCSVTVTSHPRGVVSKKVIQAGRKFQKLTMAIFLLLLSLIEGTRLIRSSISKWAKFCLIFAFVWGLRYSLMLLDFPAQLLPELFTSPSVFYLPYMGSLSNTLAELLTTVLAIFLSAWCWLRWMPSIPIGKSKILYFLLLPGQFVLFCVLLILSYQGFYSIVDKIVRFCDFHLFIHFLPSLEVLCIYLIVLLLGISLIFFYAWMLGNIMLLPCRKWVKFFGIFLAMSIALLWEGIWGTSPLLVSIIGIMSFVTAAWTYLKGFPKRYRLYYVLVLGLAALGAYTVLNHSSRYKMREEVEDYAETTREENYVPDRIQEALDTFEFEEEQKQKLINAIENEQSNIAFLLWANSNLVTLDNVEIFVYKNIAKDISTGAPPDFSQLSKLSLNMPISERKWYRSLISRLDPQAPQIIESIPGDSIPGYGNEARNVLFCVAGAPVRNSRENIIGFIVVLTRYQRLLQSFPLPEVFSTRSQRKNIPLLMAYYEGQSLLDIGNPYLAKNFRPQRQLLQRVKEQETTEWVQDWIEGKKYDDLYFSLNVPKPSVLPDKGQGFETRVAMIGYEIPSLLSRIYYFLQFFLAGIFLLLTPLWLYQGIVSMRGPFWKKPYFRFEQKILMAFLLVSGIPVVVMGYLNKEKAVAQVWQSYEKNLMEYLENADKTMREEGFIPGSMMPGDDFCRSWGSRNHRMLNVYLTTPPRLRATNRPELFQTELLSRRIPGEAYYNLMLLKRDIYVTLEPLANSTFVVGYKALSSPQDKRVIVGALAIPMIYKYAEVEREVAEKIAIIVTISIGIFFLVAITAMLLAHQITRPLTKLIKGIRRVSAGELDFQLTEHSSDEFGQLVDAFNGMTRDLKTSRERLIQAEKDAAWREMARQIAHEIKNPLTPMKLSAQHIRKAYHDRSKKFDIILEKGIVTIIDAIDSLSQTASSFSEFAKFTRPSLTPQPIYPILDECMELFSHYREEKISFKADFEESLPKISTDAYHLKRILINVLTNAVQAIEKEKGEILVQCRNEPKSGCLHIRVSDNGCGIPESIKPNLFEPNFSTKSHGSGLGLAICKRTLEHMKGSITIDSEQGTGTTVNITIPTTGKEKPK